MLSRSRIGSRLALLALSTVVGFIAIVLSTRFAFERVKTLSANITQEEVAGVLENAALWRGLSGALNEVERLGRLCPTGQSSEPAKRKLATVFTRLQASVAGKPYAATVDALGQIVTQFIADCIQQKVILSDIIAVEYQSMQQLATLENHIGQELIAETLAGRSTDHLDQLMSLVSGYRETLLSIGREMHVAVRFPSPEDLQGGALLDMVDELRLRLQTLSASGPQTAQIGRQLGEQVMQLRQLIVERSRSETRLNDLLVEINKAAVGIEQILTQLDADSAKRSETLVREVEEIAERSGRETFLASALLVMFVALILIVIISRDVNAPLKRVLRRIERLRSGVDAFAPVEPVPGDEWGTIEKALGDLSAELARSNTELRASRERLELAFLGANDGVWDWNLETDDVHYSPRWLTMLGYQPGSKSGRLDTFLELVDPAQREQVIGLARAFIDGRRDSFEVEFRMRHADGRWVDILSRATMVRSDDNEGGVPLRLVGTHVDITERNLIAAELRTHRDNLERLVRERTHDLVIAKDAAEAANRAKSAFLANMSHELRTPIHGIMGMADLARRNTSDPRLLERLSKIMSVSDHLNKVVGDILDISKIEADRLQLEVRCFSMDELVGRVFATSVDAAEAKGLEFSVHVADVLKTLWLEGDALRIEQVLINLVGNAIKFTATGEVVVDVGVIERDGRRVSLRCEVRDTGIGISDEDKDKLFLPFSQVDDSMTRRYGGTGLGLVISRKLVRLMGGDIGVESTPGEGSRFWFTLRLDEAAVAGRPVGDDALSTRNALQQRYAGLHVLVAEDDPINLLVAEEMLRLVSFEVDAVDDGDKAVQRAAAHDYDLVILDMQMPVMGGVEACTRIRKMPAYATVPILGMTANVSPEDRKRCLDAGMNEHIGKPIGADDLYVRLLACLEGKNARCAR